jgi:hypothetical protein
MKFVDKLFILDAKHLISFERSLKELSNGISKYRVFHLKKLTLNKEFAFEAPST